MVPAESAPAQYRQPSRKGKRAWRKNVDVTQVEAGLVEVRDQIIQGGVVAEKSPDELFAVDTTGSVAVQKVVRRRYKPLKVDEILAQRSAVPAIQSHKRVSDLVKGGPPKKRKVSGKDYDRLRTIAYGGEQIKKDIIQIETATTYDPWATQNVTKDSRFSFLEDEKAIREPSTLKHAPVSQARSGRAVPAVVQPSAGKSYNPRFDDWQDDYIRASEEIVAAEMKRLQAIREEAELAGRIAAISDSDSGDETVWESEWEGFSDIESGISRKRPERKTAAQRNKIKRRQEAERVARLEAKNRSKEKQLHMIKELVKAVEASGKAETLIADPPEMLSPEDDGKVKLRKRPFGKAPIPDAPLEIVLPDELRDSLRLLKPEGNLIKDRFRSLMIGGRIEARKRRPYSRRKKFSLSEKWSYRDWKLN